MQESKIIGLIRELSPKHKKSFRLFSQSPFFNKHEKTTEIIEKILDHMEAGKTPLDMKRLFSELFPSKAFDEQKLFNLMSYVKKLFNRFLGYRYLAEKEAEEELLSLEAAFHFGQKDLLINRGQQFAKYLNNQVQADLNNSYHHYRLNYLLSYNDFDSFDKSKPLIHQKMLDNLDRYYLLNKLKICCQLYSYQEERQITYHFGFFEEMVFYLERNMDKFRREPAIEMYYNILQTQRNKNDFKAYEKLKENIQDSNFNKLHEEVKKDLFSAVFNFCIRQINKGNDDFRVELFSLYQRGLEENLLLEKGLISEWQYKNITTLGCILNEFDWTEAFIERYKDNLPTSCKKNAYNFNLGNLFFHKRNFDKAIQQLQLVEFSDVKYYINVNLLLVRIYYLQADSISLMHLLDTFRLYVMRSREITTVQKKAYNNFFRYMKKLSKLKIEPFSNKTEEDLARLEMKIQQNENVILKDWLLAETMVTIG